MGFFEAIWRWGKGTAPQAVSRKEIEQTFIVYDRKLEEMNEALRAWRDHEPDRRTPPGQRR